MREIVAKAQSQAVIRPGGCRPLFRSALGPTGSLGDTAMHRIDGCRMNRRRTAQACFRVKLGCHVFWATGITAYLEAGGTLENDKPGERVKARGRRSFMIARRMPSPWMKSSGPQSIQGADVTPSCLRLSRAWSEGAPRLAAARVRA
jgi:hypothetical protein